MIRRPPRSTLDRSSAASDVYKRQDKARPCLKIEKSTTKVIIDANYEARVHVMANVDAVVVFDKNRIEIPIPGAG